jgi:hypothetical protein
MADYSFDSDTLWGCFVRETREFWWFHNKDIRIEQNITIGRIKNAKTDTKSNPSI